MTGKRFHGQIERAGSRATRYPLQHLMGRAGPWQAVTLALDVAFVILFPLPLKIFFACLVVVGVWARLWDGGHIEVKPDRIRIRSFQRADVRYSDIERVERYRPRHLSPKVARLLAAFTALRPRRALQAAEPALSLVLKRRRWVTLPLPLPLPLYKRVIYLFMTPQVRDAVIEDVQRYLACGRLEHP